MSSKRQAIESPKEQGDEEEFAYEVTTTPWASSPSSPSVKVEELPDMVDVTSETMPTGSPTIDGDMITLPLLKNLTTDKDYRVTVTFTGAGNVWELYFLVKCRD